MAKTKRTVEEAEVAAAATANSDSKLITQGKLNRFATKFWTKIKEKYNVSFKGVTLTDDKKLKFTKIEGTDTVDIDLVEYARLKDRNAFKQDVSSDNVAISSNRHIGTSFGPASQNRSLGFRQLTTNSFSDGYVDHIRVYMPNDTNTGTNSTWFVWAIKKGANGKDGDTVTRVVCNSETFAVKTANENSVEKKFVIIPIKQSFENDTYFIVRCTTHNVEVVTGIKGEYEEDVVNMNNSQPPLTENSVIDWNNGYNSKNNTALMYLFGRESIGTLSLKLNKLNSDSGLYVKQEETTNTTSPNKVVRLDNDGKLNKNMLPSIAINEYFTVAEFTHDALQSLNHFENGDVVVVTGSGADRGKRFLCINKVDGATNLRDAFIELNSKDGSVVSVNEKTGAVVLNLAATEDSLKLIIGNGTDPAVEKIVPIITDGEIDSIIEGLR